MSEPKDGKDADPREAEESIFPDYQSMQSLASDIQGHLGDLVNFFNPESEEEKVPEVRLRGIEFEWEGAAPGEGGMALSPAELGWEPENRSHVAYDFASTATSIANETLAVRARFYSSGGRGKIQVRTRGVEVGVMDILTEEVRHQYPSHDVLGTVAPSTVFFNETGFSVYRGKNTLVPLKLENVRFAELGIGVYDINWRWQFRMQDQEASKQQGKTVWQEEWHTIRTDNSNLPIAIISPFQLTRHRVYVSLDKPNHPWTNRKIPDIRKGAPMALPMWSSALEIACKWAEGAKTKEEAAQMIADQLYQCGRFVYDPEPNYNKMGGTRILDYRGLKLEENGSIAHFDFKKIIERINGGYGLGEQVNCFDCALTVVALANLLGCKLRTGRLQNNPDMDSTDENHYQENRFEIGPIKAIGYHDEEEKIAGITKSGKSYFTYHTVAWAAANGELGTPEGFLNPECKIYDACCEFETGEKDHSASGYILGNGQTPNSYVYHLAADTPDGRPRCKPQAISVVGIQVNC